ncbi:MICOS complex subunit MIC60 [Kluyveromyces marxianus]
MLRASRIVGRRLASTSAPVKTAHPIRNFFLKLTAATTAFYAGGVALSVYNYQFAELFTDNVPLAEELVQLVESYNDGTLNAPQLSLEEIRQKFGSFARRVENVRHEGSSPVAAVTPTPVTSSVAVPEPAVAVVDPSIPPVDSVLLKLPHLKLDEESVSPKNKEFVESFNRQVDLLNESHLVLPENAVELFLNSYKNLSVELNKLNKDLTEQLNAQLSTLSSELKQSVEADKAKEIENNRAQLVQQFEKDLSNLKVEFEQKFDSQLQASLKANEQALLAKHKNELAMLSIKQVQEFNKIISDKIENERNGRLKNLDELNDSVKNVSDSLESIEQTILKSECINQLTTLVSSIRFKLNLDNTPSLDLSKDLQRLKLLVNILPGKPNKCECKEPQLIDVVVKELDTLISGKSEQERQVLSNEQLLNRWNLLQEKVREASLLPPNAGFLGHISAKFFSLFLFNKSGISNDNDIDSVISRVSENIKLNRLDKAVEEVVQLQGWSRLEAESWLQAARSKLELETLVDVIDHELKTL